MPTWPTLAPLVGEITIMPAETSFSGTKVCLLRSTSPMLYQVSMIGTYRNGEGPVVPSWRTPGSPAVGSPHRDLVLVVLSPPPIGLPSARRTTSFTAQAH